MSFDFQPALRGTLVELRPLRSEDYHDLYSVAADPLIWDQHPENRHEEAVFQEFFRVAVESGGALVAIDAKTQRMIGTSRFHGHDGEKSEVEIGWTFLARSHWGGTHNGEMKQLMLQHAFQCVDNCVFMIDPQNFRSQRAVEKIGGLRVGSRPDADGRDNYVYRITGSAYSTK